MRGLGWFAVYTGSLAIVFGLTALLHASGVGATGLLVGLCLVEGVAVSAWRQAHPRSESPHVGPARPAELTARELLNGLPWFATLVGIALLALSSSAMGVVLLSAALLLVSRWADRAWMEGAATPVARLKRGFVANRLKLAGGVIVFVLAWVLAGPAGVVTVILQFVSAIIWILSARWMRRMDARGTRDRSQP